MSKTLEEIAEKISYNPAQTSLILSALRLVERQTVERCKGWMSHKKACNVEISKRHTWMKLDCSCGLEAELKKESEG